MGKEPGDLYVIHQCGHMELAFICIIKNPYSIYLMWSSLIQIEWVRIITSCLWTTTYNQELNFTGVQKDRDPRRDSEGIFWEGILPLPRFLLQHKNWTCMMYLLILRTFYNFIHDALGGDSIPLSHEFLHEQQENRTECLCWILAKC